MRTKGVLLLGFIVCWTVVCNAEDGYLYDYGKEDALSKELAEDNVFRYVGPQTENDQKDEENTCAEDKECKDTQKCVEKNGLKSCQCAEGLGGDNCETKDWCEGSGKFKNCKGENGTCEYIKDKRSVDCTCGTGKKLHPLENRCRETCADDSECNGEKCEEKDGNQFCSCKLGLIGDKCQTVFDCSSEGKYKGCTSSGGTCKYDGSKAICECTGNKKLHDKENVCKDTCAEDKECKDTQRCVEKDGWKSCQCAEGLSGDNCETKDWCEGSGKFKNCKGENGTCEYIKDKRSIDCTCGGGKKFNSEENICKVVSCADDNGCGEREKCVGDEGNKICKCADGLSGKGCETMDWCEVSDKFKACKDPNGKCEYDKGEKSVVCTCGTLQKWNSKEKLCKETCADDSECNGGKCEDKDGSKFCTCKLGLIGDKCQTVFDCSSEGKYKGCTSSGGTCKYDGSKAICECTGNKKLHDKENVCKDTCAEDKECKDTQRCVEKDGWKSCQCAEGLSGDNCETKDWCEGSGKFKNCKGENGTCEYIKDKRSVDCTCTSGKKLHPMEYRCRETCADDSECNGGNCEEKDGNKFCTCKLGLIGDKCQTVFDCSSAGKYKGCTSSGGTCKHDGSKAVCECSGNKKLHDKENVCKLCDCGPKGTCKFEDGNKKCDCPSDFAVKDGKCKETCNDDCDNDGECKEFSGSNFCVCNSGLSGDKCSTVDECGKTLTNCTGERGRCNYDREKKKAVCNCDDGKEFNTAFKYCQDTCSADVDCKGGTCVGMEEKKFCKCLPELEGDKCEIVKDCEIGKYSKCRETGGTCDFIEGKSTCKCLEDQKLDVSSTKHICRKKCSSSDDCKHGAKCEKNLCNCLKGTEGDDCDTITACDSLKCEKRAAICTYNSSKTENTFCVCEDSNYIFVKKDMKCVEKCKPKDFCIHGGKCNNETSLCDCNPNTSGDKCQDIIGCDNLKCPDTISKCVYDINNKKAICKCIEPNYYFESGQCKAKWCKDGCNTAVSTCMYENGVGTCNCKTAGTYYDYTAKTCKKFNSCFNKTCDGDLICKNGNCQCPENYRKNGTICEKMDLCKTKCFTDAKCEDISDGYVKCRCDFESKFYLPKSRKCVDGSCFIPDGRKNCKKPCPAGMSFKDGNCKHDKEENNCDKDCGFLGWCKKVGDTTQCVCLTDYAEKDSKTKKCVLKASAVCPKERDGDSKCNCKDKYKLATNGITCELKSCSDEDVQEECKSKRAKCVDSWKDGRGYDCVCPQGYIKDPKKGCLDPCSLDKMKDKCYSNGQVCYVGDKDKTGDCRCPPTFTYNEVKKSCDLSGENTFMIRKLPVLRKNYVSTENNINQVALNIDVSNSMQQAFRNLEFVHVFSSKVDKDVLLCDVWLQFKSILPTAFNATLEVQRWKSHTVQGQNEYLLPPDLLLSSSDIDAASEEELTLCSPSVQQSICGSGSICVENICNCSKGFREIESTIKASSDKRIVRCEDIDECIEGKHNCKEENSKCVNTQGSYFCKCNPGFKKEKGDAYAMDNEACVGLCHGNPCEKGTCQLTKENTIDCSCQAGYTGSFCNKADVNLAKAGKATKVVGAVLGTLLAVVIILIIVYIVRQRKNSYSEDFTPAPRVDNAEMIERRPMRGVTNRGYQ